MATPFRPNSVRFIRVRWNNVHRGRSRDFSGGLAVRSPASSVAG